MEWLAVVLSVGWLDLPQGESPCLGPGIHSLRKAVIIDHGGCGRIWGMLQGRSRLSGLPHLFGVAANAVLPVGPVAVVRG